MGCQPAGYYNLRLKKAWQSALMLLEIGLVMGLAALAVGLGRHLGVQWRRRRGADGLRGSWEEKQGLV